mmetsp:Transcript_4120/g.17219  ORF Transcript_4120/g.17219 Transcript_4120/m.17219 type:complete len:81 (+) Transcript_4120:420-662(+)
MSGMLKKEDESEKAVTLEDQKKINQFSRLLNEKLELQSFLSVRCGTRRMPPPPQTRRSKGKGVVPGIGNRAWSAKGLICG